MARFESFEQGVPCWIEHSSADVAAAQAFYADLFGWDPGDSPAGDGADEEPTYVVARLGGAAVAGLTSAAEDAPSASWGVYLAVDSVDDAVRRASESGGQVLAGPLDVDPEGRMALVADTGGATVGMWQAGRLVGTEVANEPGTAIWNELVVPDPREAASFYEQVFGVTFDTQEWPGMGSYTTVQAGGRSVAGACAPSGTGDKPHWNVYFNVASADETAARVADLGGEVVAEPVDVPGVGRMATFSDPQGAEFHVMQNPAS